MRLIDARMSLASALVALALAGSATSLHAQDAAPEASQAPLDVAVLEALCEANTDDAADERVCLRVVHDFLIPGSGPAEPAGTAAGLGDAQARDEVMITLLKADWKPKTGRFAEPGKGNKHVAILVRYEAFEDDVFYSVGNWTAADADGFEYESTFTSIEPSLGSGSLRAGKKTQGWVVFEVPKGLLVREVKWKAGDTIYLRSGIRPPPDS